MDVRIFFAGDAVRKAREAMKRGAKAVWKQFRTCASFLVFRLWRCRSGRWRSTCRCMSSGCVLWRWVRVWRTRSFLFIRLSALCLSACFHRLSLFSLIVAFPVCKWPRVVQVFFVRKLWSLFVSSNILHPLRYCLCFQENMATNISLHLSPHLFDRWFVWWLGLHAIWACRDIAVMNPSNTEILSLYTPFSLFFVSKDFMTKSKESRSSVCTFPQFWRTDVVIWAWVFLCAVCCVGCGYLGFLEVPLWRQGGRVLAFQ